MGISKRYKLARLILVLLAAGMLAFLAVSCPNPSAASGTVTMKLTNAGAYNTKIFMFGVYKEGVDYVTGTADGFGMIDIALGEAQETARNPDSILDPMIFAGGGRYYVYAFVDANDSTTPDSGDPSYLGSAFTMDGNMSQTLDLVADFTAIP